MCEWCGRYECMCECGVRSMSVDVCVWCGRYVAVYMCTFHCISSPALPSLIILSLSSAISLP